MPSGLSPHHPSPGGYQRLVCGGYDGMKALCGTTFKSELSNKPVIGVICTHMHPDHTGQSEMITNEFRCPFFMTHGEYYQARSFANNTGNSHSSWTGMDFYTRAGMPKDFLEQLGQMWAKRSADSMSMPGLPTSYERLQHEQV